MSNKVVLAVLGVIVLVSMGVGVLVGMQLGDGGEASVEEETTDAESTSTPTPVPTATETDGGSSAEATPTAERTTVAVREFDAADVRTEVARLVNERRAAQGLDPLRTDGQTAERLRRVAADHSAAMAREDSVGHDVNGTSSAGRYRNADLFTTCQFESAAGTYIIDATDNRLEAVTWTVAGREYSDVGRTKFNENETAVARDIVEKWYRRTDFEERLSYENAQRLAVGIEIAEDGTVYATANLC